MKMKRSGKQKQKQKQNKSNHPTRGRASRSAASAFPTVSGSVSVSVSRCRARPQSAVRKQQSSAQSDSDGSDSDSDSDSDNGSDDMDSADSSDGSHDGRTGSSSDGSEDDSDSDSDMSASSSVSSSPPSHSHVTAGSAVPLYLARRGLPRRAMLFRSKRALETARASRPFYYSSASNDDDEEDGSDSESRLHGLLTGESRLLHADGSTDEEEAREEAMMFGYERSGSVPASASTSASSASALPSNPFVAAASTRSFLRASLRLPHPRPSSSSSSSPFSSSCVNLSLTQRLWQRMREGSQPKQHSQWSLSLAQCAQPAFDQDEEEEDELEGDDNKPGSPKPRSGAKEVRSKMETKSGRGSVDDGDAAMADRDAVPLSYSRPFDVAPKRRASPTSTTAAPSTHAVAPSSVSVTASATAADSHPPSSSSSSSSASPSSPAPVARRTRSASVPAPASSAASSSAAKSTSAKSSRTQTQTQTQRQQKPPPKPPTQPHKDEKDPSKYTKYWSFISPLVRKVKGDGYSVTDHSWYDDGAEWDEPDAAANGDTSVTNPPSSSSPLHRSRPLTPRELSLLTPARIESALRQHGLTLIRSQRLKVKESTRQQIETAMKSVTGEVDSKVLSLCDSGAIHKCRLYRTDRFNYTLISTSAILSGEPIGAWMGTLRERASFDQRVGMESSLAHMWAFDMPAADLPKSYTGPDLVLDTSEYCNEFHFLRDPKWSARGNFVKANVAGRLVWKSISNSHTGSRSANRHRPLMPHIVLVALRRIEAHEELFLEWGPKCLKALWAAQLTALAKHSHRCHARLRMLQQAARHAGIDVLPQHVGAPKRFQICPDTEPEVEPLPNEDSSTADSAKADKDSSQEQNSNGDGTMTADQPNTTVADASTSAKQGDDDDPAADVDEDEGADEDENDDEYAESDPFDPRTAASLEELPSDLPLPRNASLGSNGAAAANGSGVSRPERGQASSPEPMLVDEYVEFDYESADRAHTSSRRHKHGADHSSINGDTNSNGDLRAAAVSDSCSSSPIDSTTPSSPYTPSFDTGVHVHAMSPSKPVTSAAAVYASAAADEIVAAAVVSRSDDHDDAMVDAPTHSPSPFHSPPPSVPAAVPSPPPGDGSSVPSASPAPSNGIRSSHNHTGSSVSVGSMTMRNIFASALMRANRRELKRIRRRIQKERFRRAKIAHLLPPSKQLKTDQQRQKEWLDAAVAAKHKSDHSSDSISSKLAFPPGSHVDRTFQLVEDIRYAFREGGCAIGRAPKSSVSLRTRKFLQEAFELASSDEGRAKVEWPSKADRRLISSGEVPKARVYAVVSLRHPARFFNIPTSESFALVATSRINMGEGIGSYIGVWRDFRTFHKVSDEAAMRQVYAYDCLSNQIPGPPNPFWTGAAKEREDALPENERRAYRGGDLVVEALSYGNEIRFINDAYGRQGEEDTINAYAHILWDERRRWPCILIRASKTIRKGQEICVDYGDMFWSKVCRSMMMEHAAYADEAIQLIRATSDWLRQNNIPLPPPLPRDDDQVDHLFVNDWNANIRASSKVRDVVYPKYFGKSYGGQSAHNEKRQRERERERNRKEQQAVTDAPNGIVPSSGSCVHPLKRHSAAVLPATPSSPRALTSEAGVESRTTEQPSLSKRAKLNDTHHNGISESDSSSTTRSAPAAGTTSHSAGTSTANTNSSSPKRSLPARAAKRLAH